MRGKIVFSSYTNRFKGIDSFLYDAAATPVTLGACSLGVVAAEALRFGVGAGPGCQRYRGGCGLGLVRSMK